MNAFIRLAFAAAFFIAVGLIETQGGPLSVSSAGDLFSAISFGGSGRGNHSVLLAQLGAGLPVLRPTHDTLDLAVRAFGYPAHNGLNLALTLAGMVLVGIGVSVRCRGD